MPGCSLRCLFASFLSVSAFTRARRRAGGRPPWLRALLVATFCLCAAGAGAQTKVATIGAGTEPLAVAVNPVTNKIYVANNSSNSVTVIDGATNTVVAAVPVGNTPVESARLRWT